MSYSFYIDFPFLTVLISSLNLVSLQDINLRKAFRSTIVTEQQVLASSTLPSAMKERYSGCDKPPRLQDMNPYRDDKKDALKFYTDPTYFFELWCEEMRKDLEKKKKRRVGISAFVCCCETLTPFQQTDQV